MRFSSTRVVASVCCSLFTCRYIMADASFASLIQVSCWQEVYITACINKTVVNDNAVSTFKRKEVEVLILLYNLLK